MAVPCRNRRQGTFSCESAGNGVPASSQGESPCSAEHQFGRTTDEALTSRTTAPGCQTEERFPHRWPRARGYDDTMYVTIGMAMTYCDNGRDLRLVSEPGAVAGTAGR
jgi:hypothetical protein